MNRTNRILQIAGIIFLILVVFALVGAVTSPNKNVQNTSDYKEIQSDVNETVFKESYMSTCNESGKLNDYCVCSYNNIRAKYTVDEVTDMYFSEDKEQITKVILDTYKQCSDKIY